MSVNARMNKCAQNGKAKKFFLHDVCAILEEIFLQLLSHLFFSISFGLIPEIGNFNLNAKENKKWRMKMFLFNRIFLLWKEIGNPQVSLFAGDMAKCISPSLTLLLQTSSISSDKKWVATRFRQTKRNRLAFLKAETQMLILLNVMFYIDVQYSRQWRKLIKNIIQ